MDWKNLFSSVVNEFGPKAVGATKLAGEYVVNTVKENPKTTAVVTGVAAGLVAGPPLILGGVTMAGLQAGGIVEGTLAANFMGTYGGMVAKGSACAILQSVGAAGTGATTSVFTGILGGLGGSVW